MVTLPFIFDALDWTASYVQFEDRSHGLCGIIYSFCVPLQFIIYLGLTFRVTKTPCIFKRRSTAICDFLVMLAVGELMNFRWRMLYLAQRLVRDFQPKPMPQLGFGIIWLMLIVSSRMNWMNWCNPKSRKFQYAPKQNTVDGW